MSGAGGRRLHRRLPEVALRRPGGGVPVGRARAPAAARPAPDGLDGARSGRSSSSRADRRDDAWRFLHGTPNIPALYAARPGLEIINRVGVEAIRAKSLRQTARLLELADARGLPCTTPRDPARRGGRSRSTSTRLRGLRASKPSTSSATTAPAPASASRPISTPATTSSMPPSTRSGVQRGALAGLRRRARSTVTLMPPPELFGGGDKLRAITDKCRGLTLGDRAARNPVSLSTSPRPTKLGPSLRRAPA